LSDHKNIICFISLELDTCLSPCDMPISVLIRPGVWGTIYTDVKLWCTVEKSTFSSQNSGTFEPIIRFGWALLIKCWLLMRLLSWTKLEFRRWQMSCWGCQEGNAKRLPDISPENNTNFLFLMFPRFRRLYLTSLVELRSSVFFVGSIDLFMLLKWKLRKLSRNLNFYYFFF
jgi:hypothetical protein